jgi:3'-phosphoadenosine 5'-phosphosulfate (PAPS) 3'-phosphatase
MERIAFKFVIGMVIKAAKKHLKFSDVLAKSDNVVVTGADDDIEEILED